MSAAPRVPPVPSPADVTSPGALPDPARVWDSDRPELLAIRWEAARRIASPWAVLCLTLTRSLLTIPHTVRYRSALHPEGSPLNMAFALVGRSGAGKSTAAKASAHAVRFDGTDLPEPSTARSGEGIPALLAHMRAGKDDTEPQLAWRRADHALWAHWDEVGMLTAQGARTGSTVLESIKLITSGEQIGGQNARGDGLTIPAAAYRAVLTVAAQPRRCGALLSDAAVAGGFAARFLWMRAEDRAAATVPVPASATEPHSVTLDHWSGVQYVDALPSMDAAHEDDTRAAHRGERDAIDSRRLLNRAIGAVALANLAGRATLTDEDWHLAGAVLAHSDATLDGIRAALAEPDPEDAEAAAQRAAEVEHRARQNLDAARAAGATWAAARRDHLSRPQRAVADRLVAEGKLQQW